MRDFNRFRVDAGRFHRLQEGNLKDDLPYFSHENNAVNHPKMKALRAQFGWEGYGRFWALNEAIARSKNVRLDLSTKVNRVTLALDLGLSVAAFDEFLAFLSDSQECGLIQYQNGIVTTHQTIEDHAKVMAERNRKRKDREPVVDYFPDQEHDFHGDSAPDQGNGAEDRENGAEESHIVEERRREHSRVLSPVAKFEEFAQSEKSDRETFPEPEPPEVAPTSSPADDFDPIATLTIPRGVKFSRQELGELFQHVGQQAQKHLDRYALKKLKHGYGYRNDWAGLKDFWANAGGAELWLAGTSFTTAAVPTGPAPDTRGLNQDVPEDERVSLEGFSARDFVRREAAG